MTWYIVVVCMYVCRIRQLTYGVKNGVELILRIHSIPSSHGSSYTYDHILHQGELATQKFGKGLIRESLQNLAHDCTDQLKSTREGLELKDKNNSIPK